MAFFQTIHWAGWGHLPHSKCNRIGLRHEYGGVAFSDLKCIGVGYCLVAHPVMGVGRYCLGARIRYDSYIVCYDYFTRLRLLQYATSPTTTVACYHYCTMLRPLYCATTTIL